ncbi:MAG: M20/M25/M40 family metallo-hydrolase, partial [Candidatus Heimdallarchaeota archaeon]|nr:M20/M25/M40 family metallo-hydrolase [Candidatus Heimdallarchaeota archaeon]
MEDFLTYLNKLVSFSSVNNPIENAKPSRDILDYINDQILAPLDYETLFYEGNGYWSLLSYIPRLKPTILFIGHCDVVPPGPKWETDPFQLTIRDDKAYGRGSADMKGAVAVMLSLAEFFKNNGTASIVYAINLDEESGGSFGAGQLLPILKEKNLVPDYVINGDANGLQIINRRRNPYVITFNLKKCVEEIRGR